MKVLMTGAFGNLGMSTLLELLRQGHQIRCFVRKHPTNERIAKRFQGKIEIAWGDIRQLDDLVQAAQDQEVIIHLAYIIPPQTDEEPARARSINVDGTRNVLEAAKRLPTPPRVLFASTFDVFGFTQDQPPPRKVTDPIQATDPYTEHKIACEELVKASGLPWTIFRFSDVTPMALRQPHPIMFKFPLNIRFELVHTYDAGLAVANGISCDAVWGKIMLIGGGSTCQVYYREYLNRMLEVMKIGSLPEQAFGPGPYCTDWLDTEESQRLLAYQRHSFDDIIHDVAQVAGPIKYLVPLVRPLARWWILRMSPYLKT